MARQGGGDRKFRVGRAIQEALTEVLQRDVLRDPELHDVQLTVLEVRTSPDLRRADVYVRPFGATGGENTPLLAALGRASSFLAGEVARRAGLRYAPRLVFRMDDTLERAERLDRLLDRNPGAV